MFAGLDEKKVPPKNFSNMPTLEEPTHTGRGAKVALLILVAVVILAIVGGAFWYVVIRKSPAETVLPASTQPVTTVPANTGASSDISEPTVPTDAPVMTNQQPTTPTDTTAIPTQPASVTEGDVNNVPAPVTTTPTGTQVPPPDSINNPSTTPAPAAVDADQDGLSDQREVELGTDPKNPDTDGDGLSDGDEISKYATNPVNRDSDGDGYADGVEVSGGYNPRGQGKCAQAGCVAN